jgi:hypothetical protein
MTKTYDEILAPLDKKWGRAVTVADWRALGRKHIAEWSDDDLLIVEAFDGRAARVAQEIARDRWLTPHPPSVPVETPMATKSAETAPAPPPATLDEFVERYGKTAVSWAGLTKTLDGTNAVFVKAIKALRQANKDLEERVLELEAQAAASKVESRSLA